MRSPRRRTADRASCIGHHDCDEGAHTLDEINEQLKRQKFYEKFPPKDVEVLSWYVVMGIGQIITLRFPTERLREINRIVEDGMGWLSHRVLSDI